MVPPCFGFRHGSESCRGLSKAEHVAESRMPIDDHMILDCFEGIPKDFVGESHHFSPYIKYIAIWIGAFLFGGI